MKAFRIAWYCKRGAHVKVVHHDDRGITGHWTCSDCMYEHLAIEWPKAPVKELK